MALVKDRMSSVQAYSYTEDLSPLYGLDEYPKVLAMEDGGHINGFDKLGHDGLIIKNMTTSPSSSPLGSPNSSNSNEFVYHASSVHQANEPHHPLINIRPTGGYHDSFIQADTGSLLSFKQKEDYSGWEAGSMSYWDNNLSPTSSSDVRLFRDLNSFQTASNFGSMTSTQKDNGGNWLYTEATIVADHIQEPVSHEVNSLKRPNTTQGESMQAAKKQCNNPSLTKKPKPKTESPSKDPQSIAAKQRRERISERLKTLQELVPNGSKVDLVTMLEKATSYVKFLQLQVKVLATDEFWPAQGGKAHDISQVKEAIEGILSSQREKSSSSK